MKIGILQCDDVNEKLQPRHGNYPEMFMALLREQDPALTFQTYRAMEGELPAHPDECDAYITTGSRHGVNDGFDWIADLEHLVRQLYEANKRLVGICFGHQLMAKALGGQVIKSEKGWGVGVSFNQLHAEQPWMSPWQQAMDLIVSHQDQVVGLPDNAQVLASSSFCPYYMVQYGDHLMSIQGHPEFSKAYSADLMQMRKGIIPENRVREGMASLNATLDDRLVLRWIVQFLRGE
ncbi:GMP synthase [Pokkaliibacter plantistimulans]|uniref:GMP synthase n=1 Tax=Proteobacteria bacterium 228 TaxID=2083153 RepID=A0A2S5KKT4_9PROT|nr:GMP synthase [Pokkaliibacter plantistimulans]PPC75129.1 GMP synthase [Pokkaliibacter plantistimulans]